MQHGWPICRGGLAEEAHGWVPGAADAGELPAPVGRAGEQEPGGDAESCGQMGCGVVDGDDEVHGGNLGGEGVDVGELIDGRVDEERGAGGGGFCCERGVRAVLEADPMDFRDGEEWGK